MHLMYYYITTIFLILLFAYDSIVFMYNPPALAKFTIEQQQLLSQEIFEKRWIHSYEEDTNDSQTYRPSTYNFPLSRGRIAFEIEKNGIFIQYGIGPDDTRKKVEGNWTIGEEEPNTIKIDFATDKPIKSYNMKIILCNDDVLRIRKFG
jgi:hypothetical protein